MSKRLTHLFPAILAIVSCTSPFGTGRAAQEKAADRLVVHEWGTFTYVLDQTGSALSWTPLSGPSDLPGFIYGIGADSRRPGARNNPQIKVALAAKVRMETPVVYFYADREMTASLKVEFPQGYVTEWYPDGTKTGPGIAWEKFKILPGRHSGFPVEPGRSRYYSARATDAAPLRIAGSNGLEDEKFLFYRGVGNFDPPFSIKLRRRRIIATASSNSQISEAVLFQNVSGRQGYQVRSLAGDHAVFQADAPLEPAASLRGELERVLLRSGLSDLEARAMLDTWADSWLEPGVRIFFTLPRQITELLLPMTIDPQPTSLERVMVCRAEIITPEMEA